MVVVKTDKSHACGGLCEINVPEIRSLPKNIRDEGILGDTDGGQLQIVLVLDRNAAASTEATGTLALVAVFNFIRIGLVVDRDGFYGWRATYLSFGNKTSHSAQRYCPDRYYLKTQGRRSLNLLAASRDRGA